MYKTKEEYLKRFAIFKDNMKKVQFLQETEMGTGVYGATHLADVTEQEFKKHYLGVDLKKVIFIREIEYSFISLD